MGDVGREGALAGEGGVEAGKQAVELIDDRLELGGGIGGLEANGEVLLAELVDFAGDAFDGSDGAADDPVEEDPGKRDGESAPADEDPGEVSRRFVNGLSSVGQGKEDGVWPVGDGGIVGGICLDGGGEGHADHSSGASVGKGDVAIAIGAAGGGAGKLAGAEGGRAEDGVGIDPGFVVIGVLLGEELGELVGGEVEDDVVAVLLGGGGEGAGFGLEGVVVFVADGIADAEIEGDAKQSEDEGGGDGSLNEQAGAERADHTGSSSARRYP